MMIDVVGTMDNEHRRLVECLQEKKVVDYGYLHYVEGLLDGNHVILIQCGIGKINATVDATELIRHFAPDCIISAGVAGGIDVCLKVMDVVVSECSVYHGMWRGEGNEYGQVQGFPAAYEGCASLLEHALSLNNAGPESRICKGLICTGDRFIIDRTELGAVKHRFPAGPAVDMESVAIAQVCHLYGIPFSNFRITSDTPGVEDHSAQYADFWGTMAERSFLSTWAFLSTLPGNL